MLLLMLRIVFQIDTVIVAFRIRGFNNMQYPDPLSQPAQNIDYFGDRSRLVLTQRYYPSNCAFSLFSVSTGAADVPSSIYILFLARLHFAISNLTLN